MPFTPSWSVIAGEIPTAAKWTQLGENADYLLELINTVQATIAPVGAVISYWSDGGAIPANFMVCDGSAVSDGDSPLDGITLPDLRNKFIRGTANANLRSTPQTGGEDTVALVTGNIPAHTHTFSGTTNTTGAHTHGMFINAAFTVNYGAGGPKVPEPNPAYGIVGNYMTSEGNHSHTYSGTTSSIGSGTAHNNIPAYTGLVQIMRIK